jgi:succinate-semialdehyde dehydrogenase / glutarate-semialdehyde dehydrogenase
MSIGLKADGVTSASNSGYGRELSELGFGEFVNRKLIDVSAVGLPPSSVSQAG